MILQIIPPPPTRIIVINIKNKASGLNVSFGPGSSFL